MNTDDCVEVDLIQCLSWKKAQRTVRFRSSPFKDLLHHVTDMRQKKITFREVSKTVLNLGGVVEGHHLQHEEVIPGGRSGDAQDGTGHFDAVPVETTGSFELAAFPCPMSQLMISEGHVKGQDSTKVCRGHGVKRFRLIIRRCVNREGMAKDVKVLVD